MIDTADRVTVVQHVPMGCFIRMDCRRAGGHGLNEVNSIGFRTDNGGQSAALALASGNDNAGVPV